MIAPQFSLDRKVAKDQDKKNLQPAGQLPARFFVGRLRSFWGDCPTCHSERSEESSGRGNRTLQIVELACRRRFFAPLRMTNRNDKKRNKTCKNPSKTVKKQLKMEQKYSFFDDFRAKNGTF